MSIIYQRVLLKTGIANILSGDQTLQREPVDLRVQTGLPALPRRGSNRDDDPMSLFVNHHISWSP